MKQRARKSHHPFFQAECKFERHEAICHDKFLVIVERAKDYRETHAIFVLSRVREAPCVVTDGTLIAKKSRWKDAQFPEMQGDGEDQQAGRRNPKWIDSK